MKKKCIKSNFKDIFFKLAKKWTCIKSWKNVHKIRGQRCFFKHATSDQSDKAFLLASTVPNGFSSCPGALYTCTCMKCGWLGRAMVLGSFHGYYFVIWLGRDLLAAGEEWVGYVVFVVCFCFFWFFFGGGFGGGFFVCLFVCCCCFNHVYPIFLFYAWSFGRRLGILKYCGFGLSNPVVVVSYYRRRAR